MEKKQRTNIAIDPDETSSHHRYEGLTNQRVIRMIDDRIPEHIQTMLKQIGALAEKEEVNVFLVGGFVRDLLLNTPNLDIDIVVEGDGIEFACQLQERFGGRLRAHQKFGTAVVVLPDDFRIDVASARTEFYEHPAALPQVEPSLIKQDLARRDFTFNTMAIELNTSHFGRLLDFFGGQRDLEQKKVRVLHNLSFVEDPTRIYRAVRLEQRHGFKIETQTENLARQAVKMDLVGRLTGSRTREELIALLSEETAYAGLMRLDDLGVTKLIHPRIVLDKRTKRMFSAVAKHWQQLEIYFPVRAKRWLVYLSILLAGLQREEIEDWCSEMKLRKIDADVLKESIAEVPGILRSLNKSTSIKNSTLYALLKGLSRETIILLFAAGTVRTRERIIRYLSTLQKTRISSSGRDLLGLGFEPSSKINETLKQILVARLDGQVKSKKDEIRIAKRSLDRDNKE